MIPFIRRELAVTISLLVAGTSAGAQVTVSAITESDLRARVGILAADSMFGRLKGSRGAFLAAEYLAREFRRLGLEPAGENGSYFQEVPIIEVLIDPSSRLDIDGTNARLWQDFLPLHAPSLHAFPPQQERGETPLDSVYGIDGARILYAGRIDDTTTSLTEAQVSGQVILFDAGRAKDGARSFEPPEGILAQPRFKQARAIMIAELDLLSPNGFEVFRRPWQTRSVPTSGAGPSVVLVTPELAERLLGAPLAGAHPGQAGKTVTGLVRVLRRPTAYPARNVLARLRGDASQSLPGIVMVGAHHDHVGVASRPYDHDSILVARWTSFYQRLGKDTAGITAPTFVPGPGRPDSVFNGADDNASGVAGILEIAEYMAKSPRRPLRSVVFYSPGVHEGDMYGSLLFLSHPTVPLNTVSSYINLEIVGRGARTRAGRPVKVDVSYSEVPPAALIAHADSANRSLGQPSDLTFSDGGCGSDHRAFNAARIPAISFQALFDPNYHQVTDEPQYLDYKHLLIVSNVALATVERVANSPVDVPRPNRASRPEEHC